MDPVTVKLNKKKNGRLLFNNKALYYLEKESGETISELASKLGDGQMSLVAINQLVWAGMLHEQSELTVDDVLETLDLSDQEVLESINDGLSKTLTQALPGQEEEDVAETQQGKAQGKGKKKG